MPTPGSMNLPKTISPEEFEYICKDVLKYIFETRFQLYGRRGQIQNGIDLYGEISSNNYIVAQCKNYLNETSSDRLIQNIKKDINSSSQLPFFNNISKFIIMTSMYIDNKVQNEIFNIKRDFNIEIWFWEDIREEICSNEHLLKKYYNIFRGSNIDILKEYFNNLMADCNILKFINSDPFVLINCSLLPLVDEFIISMKTELEYRITLQNENIFKEINEFVFRLEHYNYYLGSISGLTESGNCIILKEYTYNRLEEVRNEINKRKSELNNIYSRINENCSLFY